MQTKVLLSIKPEFADMIFAGLKRYEFRRVLFRSPAVKKILVYASSPIQRVIGEFDVAGTFALRKQQLWKKTCRHAGIAKQYFDRYFGDVDIAYAIEVSCPRLYPTPLKLRNVCDTDRPPQSFMYVA